jgi:hypothetical protein
MIEYENVDEVLDENETFKVKLIEKKIPIIYKPNFKICHYLIWNINENLSLRYYFTFETQKGKENKFYLKSHDPKGYEEITDKIIISELQKHAISFNEIIGRNIDGVYKKVYLANYELENIKIKIEEKN